MFIKIPFESEIAFKTNIKEITKMSLEHDFNVNDDVVLGNFYVSGEYIAHEVSINATPFNYTLPFSVELRSDIKKDTIEFNIEDFSYEIIDNNKLKVNIEYSLAAEATEELFKKVDEENLSSELEFIDNFLEEEKEDRNDSLETNKEIKEEESNKENVEEKDNRLEKIEEKTIMETIKDSDDTFVTYHVHIVKSEESIDTICGLYNVPSSLISEYNDIENIVSGDKIIIPKFDE